jgi:hypothetical protein
VSRVIIIEHLERVGHAPAPQPNAKRHGGYSLCRLDAATKIAKKETTVKQITSTANAAEAGTIARAIPATTEPEIGEPRCPNGHDSAIPPRCPALMFVTCWHYSSQATWNQFCITCGVRHAPFRIYWHSFLMDDLGVRTIKNYCGFCGAKIVTRMAK